MCVCLYVFLCDSRFYTMGCQCDHKHHALKPHSTTATTASFNKIDKTKTKFATLEISLELKALFHTKHAYMKW